MEVHSYCQLLKIHKQPSKEPTDLYFENNPEDIATSSLLELSNDFSLHHPFERQPIPKFAKNQDMQESFLTRGGQRKTNLYRGRLSVTEKFTQCHRMSRKQSTYCISNAQTEAVYKRSPLNPSSFLLFENGKLKNQQRFGLNYPNVTQWAQKGAHHYKGLQKIAAFIRRKKNPSSREKQQVKRELLTANSSQLKGNYEPLIMRQKMVKSCELTNYTKQISPLRTVYPQKIGAVPNIELSCTDPNFKYRRFLNYRKIFAKRQL